MNTDISIVKDFELFISLFIGILLRCIWFVYSNNPWFDRGNNFNVGSETGVFAFGNANGSVSTNGSFRE